MYHGTPEEYVAAGTSYPAYSGPYYVDEVRRTVDHEMYVSLFPNWKGQRQVRIVKLDGDEVQAQHRRADPVQRQPQDRDHHLAARSREHLPHPSQLKMREMEIMYAITGITGKVGGALARGLLAERLPVRAVLRDKAKAMEWSTQGCDVALAEMDDAASLTTAFKGAAGVFILPPAEFDPEPGFPEARRVIAAVTAALAAARPGKVVCLSTIGADAPHENLLTERTLMEQSLEEIGLPVTFLRPGWFMENALWDVPSARDEGVLRSFLQPADKRFPMVATQDVGRLAATLLREDWIGTRGRRAGGARTHIAERSRPSLRHGAEAPRPGRNGAARQLGADLPHAGNAKSIASDPDA